MDLNVPRQGRDFFLKLKSKWLILLLGIFLPLLFSSADSNNQVDPGYIVFKALSQSYSDEISKLSFRSRLNDWSIKINGTWFNWANGRILPDDMVADFSTYRSVGFYYYGEKLPSLPLFTLEEEKKFLQRMDSSGDRVRLQESNVFRQGLYQAPNKQAMNEQIQEIPFLEFRIKVHPMIIWPLKRIERRLLLARRSDPKLDTFFRKLKEISTYRWRKIQYFEKLSNHSFGTALDFLPRSWDGKAAYWNWERDYREDWYNIPYEKRWSPPQTVIDVFEAEGFIWGGKWLYFDPMHFEYRPELFLLRGYLSAHPLNDKED